MKENISKTDKPADGAGPVPDLPEKALVVLSAARTIFLRHGFSASTTDMIQREAGVSKSTLYAHFGSKEGMFAAVIKTECAKRISRVNLVELTSENLREQLLALGRAYLDILLAPDTIALYRTVIEVAPVLPELADLFYKSGPQSLHLAVRRCLEVALQEGRIVTEKRSIEELAELLTCSLRGELHMRCALYPGLETPQPLREQWLGLAVDSFLAAYGTGASRAIQ